MPAPVPPGHITPSQLAERWGCRETCARVTARRLGVMLRQRRTFDRGGVYSLAEIEKAEKEGWQ